MVLVPRVPAGRAVLDGLSTSITRQSENKKPANAQQTPCCCIQCYASQAPAAGPHLASRHALLQRRHT